MEPSLSTHRDVVDLFALYLKSLQRQDKPLPQTALPLQETIVAIMNADPRVTAAKTMARQVREFPVTNTSATAQRNQMLEQTLQVWTALMDRYPLVMMNKELPEHKEVGALMEMYAEVLKSQGQTLPDESPLKAFVLE
jgi:hypothetical protein